MNKFIFWNVDTQKDFMLPNGKLYIKGAEKILPNLKLITKYAVENNITVINSADFHSEKTKEISKTPDFINTFPEHCMGGSEEAEFVDETYPKLIERHYQIIPYDWNETQFNNKKNIALIQRAKDIIILKDDFDVFKGNPFTDAVLGLLNPEVVIVYGVALDVCVKFAIEGLIARQKRVILIEDATKELFPDKKNDLLRYFADMEVSIIDTQTLISL